MVRAVIQYASEPDAGRYAQRVAELASKVGCDAYRHGRVLGSPLGEPSFAYYAEFEWSDMDAFRTGARSPEFAASGEDATGMGIPFTVHFVELSE